MDYGCEINRLISTFGFVPRRKFGQNFVVDPAAIQRVLAAARLKQTDTVLEIGAGTGFLTRELQKTSKVIAVENDHVLCNIITAELDKKNLSLIAGNFLAVDLPPFNKVVSFPPYTISAKIIQRLLSLHFELAILVFQKEFVEKLLALPGFEQYTMISVLTQYHFVPDVVGKISKNSFFPVPQADSLILKLTPKKIHGSAKNDEKFHCFVKQLFRHGKNNVEKALHLSYPFIRKIISLEEKDIERMCSRFPFREKKVNQLEVAEIVSVFNNLA